MKELKYRIERKTGILFGVFAAPVNPDYRFIIRLGAGDGRKFINFEIGFFGYSFYVSHEPDYRR
jgi:hypothetical protein